MAKAKAHPDQLPFDFAPPTIDLSAAAGAGLEQRICNAVGEILATVQLEGMTRGIVAARMSDWLAEEIGVDTLNAMSSPARKSHKVHMSRFFALLAVTGSQHRLDPLTREIGVATIEGDEVLTVELGHIDRQIAALRDRRKRIEGRAPPIREGGTSGKSRR